MSKTYIRTVSVLASLALLGATAGVASLASAQTPTVTTQAATNVTASNATLNATNGSSGTSGSAFWVSTSSTALSGLSASTSPTLPSNVYSTGNLGNVGGGANFSANLTSATIPAGFSVASSTTYYYVAWVNVGGTWYPGSVGSVTTSGSTNTTGVPVISNVMVSNVGSTSATVSWNTDIAGSGTVWYGLTSGYGSSITDNTVATSHSVTLNGLSPNTMYHFTITAAGGSGTGTTTDRTFTTGTTTSTTPLAVTGIDTIRSTGIADNSFSDGWEWVMHLTVPNNENAFHIKFSDWSMNGNTGTTFPANGNIEVWSAQSSNATGTGSAIVSSGNGYSGWLYLTGDSDNNSANGRQVDLHILVKIPTGTPAGSYTTTFTAQSWPSTSTSTAPTI